MRILTYRDLRPGRFSKALDRLRIAISQGNFATAGLKKLSPKNFPDYAPCSAAGSLVQIANIIDFRGVF